MRPEEYAGQYRQFSTYVRNFGDTRPFLIACGPNGNNTDWSRRFMDHIERRHPNGYSMHFYSNGKNTATQFTVENMREQLSSFARLEQGIQQQRALLDGYDPERRIGLMVDEWGVWDRMVPEEEKTYGRLFQQITMRSAVAAALGLNVFHRQADKLYMCNIAQIVNVLHSLLLTHEDKCIRTTTYYAFDLLKAHRGKTAVRTEQPDVSALGVSVSASRRDRELALTLINPKHDAPVSVNCALAGGSAASATAQILHHPDFNAANTFATPDAIVPKDHRVVANGSKLQIELPPLSIVTARVMLS
jgi:alpha-N-arabinofuranosidase